MTRPAPPTPTTDCPSCGAWVCNDCGWRRVQANRYAVLPQNCGNCGRLSGYMERTRHSNRDRAEEHLAGHLEVTAAGITPMYLLEAPTP
ncbi:hypothetical protein [Microbacterium sp. Yaish 1]|uniref:hypothetical protein n=1 Tax=Microbacterium sp. Yaish 1 TaxID=2025014 RepID=UPI00117D4D2E|nr:hypothetical protein [Microbacterium sp. Yaish 1]